MTRTSKLLCATLLLVSGGCFGVICDPDRECEPREERACDCPGGYQERHACNLSGTGWSDCPCVLLAPCDPGDDCGDHASCDPASETCQCDEGFHGCAGVCRSDLSVLSCGAACSPCPVDPNGDTSCDGERCQLDCAGGYLACGGRCAPCVQDLHGSPVCAGARCTTECDDGYRLCQEACVLCPDADPRFLECAGAVCAHAQISVAGALQREDASLASGAPVVLEVAGEQLAAAVTDSAGGYAFAVDTAQILDPGTGAPLQLGVRGRLQTAAGEAEVGYDFLPAGLSAAVPALRFLEAAPMYSVGADLAATIPNWRDADGQPPAAYRLESTTPGGELLASAQVSSGSSVALLDVALLEDFASRSRLLAVHQRSVAGVDFEGFSAQAPFELEAQLPPPGSRGASCTYAHLSAPDPLPLTPCPITDGDLDTRLASPSPLCVDPDPTDALDECAAVWEEVVIDLGEVRALEAVAVHALGAGVVLTVSRSDDGAQFTNVATIDHASAVQRASFSARFLRLSATGPGEESRLASLNEVAVY